MNDLRGVARERLTYEQYMPKGASIAIFHDSLRATVKLHWHEFYEISYIVSGKGWNVVNGVQHALRKGSIFLLTPSDFHEILCDKECPLVIYNVIFTEEILDDELRRLLFDGSKQLMNTLVGDNYRTALYEYKRIFHEQLNLSKGSLRIMRGALDRLLVDLARSLGCHEDVADKRALPPSPIPETIRRSLQYIHHHFREQLRLEDVARQAALAPNYFSSSFHYHVGIPFRLYLQDLRLRFAKTLLQVSDIPVTEVCSVSGFGSLPHFERMFKHKSGYTPREFRAKSRYEKVMTM